MFSVTTLSGKMVATVLFLQCLGWMMIVGSASETDSQEKEIHEEGEEEEEIEPVDAILFPFFILALGIVSHWLLSRNLPWLPYTAVLFILGAFIGAGATRLDNSNFINKSVTEFWLNIDSELLLVAFLPGLIYHDASGQNTHLFRVAFSQCAVFAFPMVLAGTTLVALVAFYIFPYDWSFNLCMTFGSILAATDPVAVAALLEQVGAPPRLKVHIAGESLLNDGSAIVFFNIFSSLFLLELGVDGVGEDIDGPKGVSLFFQLAVGGFCVGVFFAIGLLFILHTLNRRLEKEENVTQVGATITIAYLCYFVADVVWGTSGVIAVVTLGVITSTFGDVYVNDPKLMADFWSIVEWLLNTVLFSVGGLVWGRIISNRDEIYPDREFTGEDWGYLLLLYVLLAVIRFGLFAAFYPITAKLGLGTNRKEMIFQSFGGLRGAVGISLAIFLDNTVRANATEENLPLVLQTNQVFGHIGGIALLTLIVNGVFAGPLLVYLGLADTSDTRKRMLKAYREHYRRNAIDNFVKLLAQRRFKRINFGLVRSLTPVLADVTRNEIEEAAHRIHGNKRVENLDESFNSNVIDLKSVLEHFEKVEITDDESRQIKLARANQQKVFRPHRMIDIIKGNSHITLKDFRRLFLELVRSAYQEQVSNGELADREFIALSLQESLEWAAECVDNGHRLNDWDFIFIVQNPSLQVLKGIQGKLKKTTLYKSLIEPCVGQSDQGVDASILNARLNVEKCMAFIRAHTLAQERMKEEFTGDVELEEVEKNLLAESESQICLAEDFIKRYPEKEVELIMSHVMAKILLIQGAGFVEELVENGLLNEQEAGDYLEEIDESLKHVDLCTKSKQGKKEQAKDEDPPPKENDMVVEA